VAPGVVVEEGGDSIASVILLGSIAFVMTIFYLVNSHVKGVADQTWSMISSSVSIFAAVMMYNLVHGLSMMAFKQKDVEEGVVPGVGHVAVAVAQLILWYFAISILLFIFSSSPLRLKAYGTLGGHILGFAAIHCFGYVALTEYFNYNPWMTFVVLIIYFVTIPILVLPTRLFGHLAAMMKCSSPQDIDRLHEHATDTGTDFFAMGAAFIISLAIRGVIKGKVMSIEPEGGAHTTWEVVGLHLIAIAFLVLGGLFTVAQHWVTPENAGKLCDECMDILVTTLSLTSAFCFLDAASWLWLQYLADKTLGELVIAMLMSLNFVIFVFLLHFIVKYASGARSKRILRGMFTAVALTVGLSWEHVFDAALEGASKYAGEGHEYFESFLTLVLVVVVLPAWVVYILPKHDDELKKLYSYKRLNCCAVCCDCTMCDDESSDPYGYDSQAWDDPYGANAWGMQGAYPGAVQMRSFGVGSPVQLTAQW